MSKQANLYDELPYKSYPIEWTAPERLALASLLHGGPRPPLDDYRVLELGCGDGANLLPLAYYRRHADFVGVDGAGTRIAIAENRRADLGLSNLKFIQSDFLTADSQLSGQFDYILAHGVFSWVPDNARDALLELCAQRLRPGGLLYLNYNCRPGWNVRGMVRDFLTAQTAEIASLRLRAASAQEVSARVIASLAESEHPYSKLISNEFRFVCENDVSYIAHEFLAPDNHPYWRSEFLALVHRYGFEHVADADFNYASGRIPENLEPRLSKEQITGRTIEDTIDLLCYRQLHSPILTRSPLKRQPPDLGDLGSLVVASCLAPCASGESKHPMFRHPSGYEVEAREETIRCGLEKLLPLWPRGLRVRSVFPNISQVSDDLRLLQANGLLELRSVEPGDFDVSPEPLNRLEALGGGYITTAYHTREASPAHFESGGARVRDNRQVPPPTQFLDGSAEALTPAMASATA